MKVRVLVLALSLSAGLSWSAAALTHADAASGGEGVFEPIDAEALIAACAAAADLATGTAAGKELRYGIAYVECIREAIVEQYAGVIAAQLSFNARDGADMGDKRSYWQGRAEWVACIPSCEPIEQVGFFLDHAVKVREAVLRDVVAEYNIYAGGEKVFSQSTDGPALSEACWDISDNQRGTGVTNLMRWGTLRTAMCLEYVILDQVEILFEPEYLSRHEMRKKIDDIRNAYGSFYWSLYNDHNGCDPTCGTLYHVFHLSVYADLLRDMIGDIVAQRRQYGL